MNLHCSRKLASKLPQISALPSEDANPLGDWHGHLFVLDRRQCVMFVHDATRFVLFLPGLRKEQFAVLGEKWFRPLYLGTLLALDYSEVQMRKVELILGPVRYDAVTDRSVLSSLQIARQDLEGRLYEVPNVMDLDPIALCRGLNTRPATIHGRLVWPMQAMQERITAL